MARKIHIGRGCMADDDEIPDAELEKRLPLKHQLQLARRRAAETPQTPPDEDLATQWQALKEELRR